MSHNPIAYKITDEDVESILKSLKKHHPEEATAEKAKAMLENLQEFLHLLADEDPQLLNEFYKILEKLRAQKD